jgi:hypothetical protein
MSYIEKRFNKQTGKVEYEVGVSVQDGIDRVVVDDEQEAFQYYRQGIKCSQGFPPPDDPDPDGKTISIPPLRDQTRWPEVIAEGNNRYTLTTEAIQTAMHLALWRKKTPLIPGARYRFKAMIEKLDDPFLGENI